jgi:uncharacterized membrane protein YfhO
VVLGDYSFLKYSDYVEYLDTVGKLGEVIEDNQKHQGLENEIFRLESDYYPHYYYLTGYPSLYHYSSVTTACNAGFLSSLGFNNEFFDEIKNNMNLSPEVAGFVGIKYLISEKALDDIGFKLLYQENDHGLYLYENTKSLPFAFCAPGNVGASDYSKGIKASDDEEYLAEVADNYGRNGVDLVSKPFSHYSAYVNMEAENDTLYLLIPYDKGWHARINGKKADVSKTFGFYMSLGNLPVGEYSVELYYIPPYMKAGIILSLICVAVVIVDIIRNKNSYRLLKE